MYVRHLKNASVTVGKKDNCCLGENVSWSLCVRVFSKHHISVDFQKTKHIKPKMCPPQGLGPLAETEWYSVSY